MSFNGQSDRPQIFKIVIFAFLQRCASIGAMKEAQDIGILLLRVVFFFIVSLIFLPAFFIVTYLQDFWSKQLEKIFKV
jgi:hypothetical protein